MPQIRKIKLDNEIHFYSNLFKVSMLKGFFIVTIMWYKYNIKNVKIALISIYSSKIISDNRMISLSETLKISQ